MSSRPDGDVQLCWLARDRYHNQQWVVMFDPVPGIDRAEWIGELKGPFSPLWKAQQICRLLNSGLANHE